MKITSASVERSLPSALAGFKDRANAVRATDKTARQAIKDDPRKSDLAKRDDLAALTRQTKTALEGIRAEQDSHVKSLNDQIERELRGNQPTDAASIVSRRDASDRVRKLSDKEEAMSMLQDAIQNGDADLAHAIGNSARGKVWLDVAEAYQAAHPATADSAQALAYVEQVSTGPAYNLSNSITYSVPTD